MFRIRLGMCAVVVAALAAAVGAQDPKAEGKKFDLKLEKDKKFYQEMTTAVTQIIKVQGQDLTQKQDSTFYFKWTPVKQEGDKWHLEQEVEGLKMTIDISGNQIAYDSTKVDGGTTASNPTLSQFFKALVGAKFNVILDKNQKVEKVEGKDKLIGDLGAGSPSMDTLLKSILTEDALKDMCDPTFKIIPDSPKKKDETWERKSTVSLGPIGSYDVTYKFKYVGPGDGDKKDLDKIEVDTALTYTAPKTIPDGLLFRIKDGKLTSTNPAKGIILYNPKTGRIESADIKIKLTGELTVTIGNTDTKVELNQEQTTTIKTSDTSLLPAAPKK